MERKLEYIIENEFHNKTIEQFLKSQEFPHQAIVQLKKTTEGICRNGTWAYINEKLCTGDTLSLYLVEDVKNCSTQPIYVPLSIIFEDEDLLIIDKPANMPIHPSMNHHEGTLANGLMYYFNTKGQEFTFRCINRLDRDTSGLTIIAKHLLSGGILSRQVSARQIKRTYRAICTGYVQDSGTIDAPIARTDDSTIERCVDYAKGERAVTHFKRIAYDEEKDLSLVELHLETGRTHQIRVHMSSIGHPLLGDEVYAGNRKCPFPLTGQTLHAKILGFVHPSTGDYVEVDAPLPDYFETLLQKLK